MGRSGDSKAIHSMEETTIPADSAPANGAKCDESDVRRMANSSLVSSRDIASPKEYPSSLEGECLLRLVKGNYHN